MMSKGQQQFLLTRWLVLYVIGSVTVRGGEARERWGAGAAGNSSERTEPRLP